MNDPLSKLEPEEPFFLIRARDIYAPAAIQAYATISNRQPECHEIIKKVLDWQKRNQSKVRRPD